MFFSCSVHLDLERFVAEGKRQVQREMDVKLSRVGDDLRQVTALCDSQAEQVKELENSVRGMMEVVLSFHPLSSRRLA